ncbi:transposase [Streptomyces javensis]|uniref:transposase n=1 Tax=Streptomyces javensis TaxID=114698 RepID=UPI003F4D1963
MKKRIGSYPHVRVEGVGRSVVSQAGAVLLVETVRKSGLDAALSQALALWRKAQAVHNPGQVLLDVALAAALGGDCLADVGLLRAEPLAGDAAPDAGGQVIVDIDGVLVLAHSEKQDAAATWKKTFGHR